ncbi:MAG TPA: excinuclease ABC subunit C [Clostridia bacterium]|nr:excinuclease ABC subunit C [Clostridia bacterium]
MLAHKTEFRPREDREFFASLPASTAVYTLRGEDPAAQPYVGKTSNLRRRMQRLLAAPEGASKRLNLRDRVRWVEYQTVGGDFEAGLLLYRALRAEFPATYAQRLRLRPAPLVKFILDNAYPRLSVTTRIGSLRSQNRYYGPFPTRAAAEQFAGDSLDFFLLRRCTEDLAPDPSHPGCVYSEMKMCMAPCFQGCTDEAYAAESERVQHFLATGGTSLVHEITRARDEASERLEFEAAAAAHTRLEKVKHLVQQLPELVRRLDQLNGVMVQPSQDADSVTLFKIEAGMICAPVRLPVNIKAVPGEARTPQSMEARITEALTAVPACEPHSAAEWMENLAILKRWFYRTSKIGELFLADDKGDLPMRRVVRGVSRVFKGEAPKGDLSETAGEYWRFRYGEFVHGDES